VGVEREVVWQWKMSEVAVLESKISVANNQINGLYSELGMQKNPSWSTAMTSFRYLFNQLESMAEATQPTMQLKIPEPLKPTEHAQEIPFLLSTMVTAEEETLIDFKVEGEGEEKEGGERELEMLRMVEKHNGGVSAVVELFTDIMETNKERAEEASASVSKSAVDVLKSKSRKRTADFLRQYSSST
jgi:hypothetical protein